MKRIRTDHVSLRLDWQALITSHVIERSVCCGVSKDHLLAGRAFQPFNEREPLPGMASMATTSFQGRLRRNP
jgi:hypothetical protein